MSSCIFSAWFVRIDWHIFADGVHAFWCSARKDALQFHVWMFGNS